MSVLDKVKLGWAFSGRDGNVPPHAIYVTAAGLRRLLRALGTESGHHLSYESDPAGGKRVTYLGMDVRVLSDDEFVIV